MRHPDHDTDEDEPFARETRAPRGRRAARSGDEVRSASGSYVMTDLDLTDMERGHKVFRAELMKQVRAQFVRLNEPEVRVRAPRTDRLGGARHR